MPVHTLTQKISLGQEDIFLLPGYTMSDLGFIQQILEHVSNPASTMMLEDFSSISFRYTEKYRDLHPYIFQSIEEAIQTDPAMQDKTPLERVSYYMHVTDSCDRIDWGYHEPEVVPGHTYHCEKYIADVKEEMSLVEYLISQDHDDRDEFRAWWKLAIRECKRYGFIYGGVKMWRAIYWMNHLSMFDYSGLRNEFADEWEDERFKLILGGVVMLPVPFYVSDTFGEKKPRKDKWLVSKNQAYSLLHVKQEGQMLETPPKVRSSRVRTEVLGTRLGLFGRKDAPTFSFKVVSLPTSDGPITMGELTEYQKQQLERNERSRFFELCDELEYQEKQKNKQ